jgi:beta-galactosidase/beta-glucuronidase
MKYENFIGGIEYPRPQLRRKNWTSLDGVWQFTFDDDEKFSMEKKPPQCSSKILVPFAPESKKSGIHDESFHKVCWYQREFEWSRNPSGRTLLHFGAVDYQASVWLNGIYLGRHEGAFTPFSFEITDALMENGPQKITVRVEDDPQDLAKPRGKQDWELKPHSIWYPRTTGIWQTVWVENVPECYIDSVWWDPYLERWEIGCEAFIIGNACNSLRLRVRLIAEGKTLADDTYHVINAEIHRRISLSDPGIDDFRNKLLWSPERPNLILAQLELLAPDGQVVDSVESYTALRSVRIQKDRFMLNGRPYYLRLVLDQGYWPESLMTAPTLEAFEHDIELTKSMGFNGVRKHQKVEDPRYLFIADVLGLLVWEEMPSAYRFTHKSVERILREWTDVIDRDINHPSVVVWVPFNESWGVPDLPEKKAHQHCVQALYHLTKTLDPSRPVVGNDGWEATATDIIGIHDYDGSPERLTARYRCVENNISELLDRRRPGGRLLTVAGYPHQGQPIMLTEFGGITIVAKKDSPSVWGYTLSGDRADFEKRYRALLLAVNNVELFAGFCYTQLTDTFQEANGLLTADREPKIPVKKVCEATRGRGSWKEDYSILSLETEKLSESAAELLAVPQHAQIPRDV